ncbi:MAG: XRE family transcriptional regulator [Treponema sp.]|nr:XRE family transcriptional regulator [Treponema sp.]
MASEADRYNIIQQGSGLSKKDFAESLGLSKAMGYQISTGMLKPSREVMEALRQTYNVNLHWFLTGIGSSGYDPDTVLIELLDQEAAAGQGKEVDSYIEKRTFQVPRSLIAPYRSDRLQAVYVAGDSMIDEHINDGDIAIFHPNLKEGNGIYVISVGNNLMVKRVDFNIKNQTIILISANKAYEPRRFSGLEIEDIRIAGRVLACVHRV